MATVPSGQKFHTVPSNVETNNLGSKLANDQREIYTMQDITDTVSANIPTQGPKMLIAEMIQQGTQAPSLVNPSIYSDFLPSSLTRINTGRYAIIFPSGTFTEKTIVSITPSGSNNSLPTGLIGITVTYSLNKIDIITKDPSNDLFSDDYLTGATLTVQVYE